MSVNAITGFWFVEAAEKPIKHSKQQAIYSFIVQADTKEEVRKLIRHHNDIGDDFDVYIERTGELTWQLPVIMRSRKTQRELKELRTKETNE